MAFIQSQMNYFGFDDMKFFDTGIEPSIRKHHSENDIQESKIPEIYSSDLKCALQEHPFRYLNYSQDLWSEIVRATPSKADLKKKIH